MVVFIEAAQHFVFSGGSDYSKEGSVSLGSPHFSCRMIVQWHQLGATDVIYYQLFPKLFALLSMPPKKWHPKGGIDMPSDSNIAFLIICI